MENNNKLTAERSLEIIAEQIEQSQRMIKKNSALPMIWWGMLVTIFALLIAYLWKHHGGPVWNALWFLMAIIGLIGNLIIEKRQENAPPSFVGKTIGHVWATFGIIASLIGWTLFMAGVGWIPAKWVVPDKQVYINITSVICLCYGFGSTITGFVLKSRVFLICGIIAGVGGYFLAMHYPWVEQMYVMAGVAFIGLVIPGLIVHFQNQK